MSDQDSQQLFKSKDAYGMRQILQQGDFVRVGKIVGVVLVMIITFGLGLNIGNGHINVYASHTATGNLPKTLDYTSVNQVYQALKSNYDGTLDANKLLDGMKNGLASATGDPYTEYFSASQAKDLNNELNGTFTGIGAELGQDAQGDLQVVAPINGFPAAQAGLRAQDIITAINGTSTSDMSVDTAVGDIRGPKGSSVSLQVLRGSQTLTFKITREAITVPSVTSKVLSGNIGYMQITQFTDDTSSLAQKAAKQFAQAGVKGIILDLRDNPGGILNSAVDVSSLWVPHGQMIVEEKRGSVITDSYTAEGDDILNGIPTVVLLNGGSASASEITASALRDNDAAHLIGERSYGKGSVQAVLDLSQGAELKVTVAKWYRPNGQNIDKQGITPDQVVAMTDNDYRTGQDPQQAAALAWLQSQK